MEILMAIDPGRAKCGIAVVDRKGTVLFVKAVENSVVVAELQQIFDEYVLNKVVMGNGTDHINVLTKIKAAYPNLSIEMVDEKNTTLMARKLYWQYNKPSFWQNLIPYDWRTTPILDGYAALAIAIKYMEAMDNKS